jgi:hypothetical protein
MTHIESYDTNFVYGTFRSIYYINQPPAHLFFAFFSSSLAPMHAYILDSYLAIIFSSKLTSDYSTSFNYSLSFNYSHVKFTLVSASEASHFMPGFSG